MEPCNPHRPQYNAGRCTVDRLAAARGVPAQLLRELGWHDTSKGVAIPWSGGAVHVRHLIEKTDGQRRWSWMNARLMDGPYGHDRLSREEKKVLAVESEVDAVAAWTAGIPAIATGGADFWRAGWWSKIGNPERVVAWAEDAGSWSLLQRLAETRPHDGPELWVCSPLWTGADKDPGLIVASRGGTGSDAIRSVVEHARKLQVVSVGELVRAIVADLGGTLANRRSVSVCCPFHEDRSPSLSIYLGADDREKEVWWWRCRGPDCIGNGRGRPLTTLAMALGCVAVDRASSTLTAHREIEVGEAPKDLADVPDPGPRRFTVEDFIVEGRPTNLYADSGQGKSYLVLIVAGCLIRGEKFLGRDAVKGPVLLLDWELDEDEQRRRWGEVARGLGLQTPPRGLYYVRMKGSLHQNLHSIKRVQAKIRPVLTVLDSMGKALGADPMMTWPVIQYYEALDELGTVLNIDHQAKPSGEGYASKWEYGNAYKRHYARASWQLERVGGKDGQVGLVLRHKKSNFGKLCDDIHAALTFSQDAAGLKVSLEPVATAEQVAGQVFGLRGQILKALQERNATVVQLDESIDAYGLSSIGTEVSALKKAGLVDIVGKDGRSAIYGIVTESKPDQPDNEQVPTSSTQTPKSGIEVDEPNDQVELF